jgi:hypothetical protein
LGSKTKVENLYGGNHTTNVGLITPPLEVSSIAIK